MATGVKPRDDDFQLSRSDLEAIQDAMKNKKFRDMFAEYVEEVRDPANQALYQKEMTQLEKERGYDITFINPKGGYVIKTSVAGDRKAFINICSNDKVAKPSCHAQEVDGKRGLNWQIPYSLIPPREDYDKKKQKCVIYDVVFHPDTLRMAEANQRFRELVNNTALDGLHKNYNIHLDSNNFRFPKSQYKGMATPAVIRKEDPNYNPQQSATEDTENLSPEMLQKLFPQHSYGEKKSTTSSTHTKKNPGKKESEFLHTSENGYTVPKYVIKQQKNVDLQDFTYHKDSKQDCAIPSHLVVEVSLPLLSSTKECALDVREKSLTLVSEKPAKYKLELTLPYAVNDNNGSAKFDLKKRKLIVTLPVVKKSLPSDISLKENNLKSVSGLESEENSGSQSDDEPQENLIQELPSPEEEPCKPAPSQHPFSETVFLEPTLGYSLPSYTHNVLDDVIAFTFHVKNTDPESVQVKQENNKVYIKFTSIGSSFVPVHYAAIILFEENIHFENLTGEAWDNNVILQMDVSGKVPQDLKVGLTDDTMVAVHLDMSSISSSVKEASEEEKQKNCEAKDTTPVVEVTSIGSETNIVVSSNSVTALDDEEEDSMEPETNLKEKYIVWTDSECGRSRAKSILRKSMTRSFSESSAGDVASSMDYISSDYIPEESSFNKKSVRFSNVIARQFYRYNSSIEGQKKKNQRKKSKKRSQERRKSESEAEEEQANANNKISKGKLKPAIKLRRDSGLADTSDGERDVKTPPAISETPPVLEGNIKHNTQFYDPDRLYKGCYLEVNFKNDLIFDLDM